MKNRIQLLSFAMSLAIAVSAHSTDRFDEGEAFIFHPVPQKTPMPYRSLQGHFCEAILQLGYAPLNEAHKPRLQIGYLQDLPEMLGTGQLLQAEALIQDFDELYGQHLSDQGLYRYLEDNPHATFSIWFMEQLFALKQQPSSIFFLLPDHNLHRETEATLAWDTILPEQITYYSRRPSKDGYEWQLHSETMAVIVPRTTPETLKTLHAPLENYWRGFNNALAAYFTKRIVENWALEKIRNRMYTQDFTGYGDFDLSEIEHRRGKRIHFIPDPEWVRFLDSIFRLLITVEMTSPEDFRNPMGFSLHAWQLLLNHHPEFFDYVSALGANEENFYDIILAFVFKYAGPHLATP